MVWYSENMEEETLMQFSIDADIYVTKNYFQ